MANSEETQCGLRGRRVPVEKRYYLSLTLKDERVSFKQSTGRDSILGRGSHVNTGKEACQSAHGRTKSSLSDRV